MTSNNPPDGNKTEILEPNLGRLRAVAQAISPYVIKTPVTAWPVPVAGGGPDMELMVKLELFQRTGSFKARGAINNVSHAMQAQSVSSQSASSVSAFAGVTAFSAGNHAIATAFAAKVLGTTAKVVMPRTANQFRRERCLAYGAELVLGDTISDLMGIVQQIQADEARHLVHPFEGIRTIEGTATVGLELCDQLPDLDVVIVPVGGGGLISGVACAVKQMQPHCRVIGVEPTGANGMQQSLAQHAPMERVAVDTIADSLGAPMHAPLSYSLVERFVDEIVTVTDEQMLNAMRQMFLDMKLAVEPACAAALAALRGPLAGRYAGKRVALVACGSNIDTQTHARMLGQVSGNCDE